MKPPVHGRLFFCIPAGPREETFPWLTGVGGRAADTCLSIFFTNFPGPHDYARDRRDLAFYYGQYVRLMDHWRRVLPADRFTEVEYERLVADREAETRRLIAFLGLD